MFVWVRTGMRAGTLGTTPHTLGTTPHTLGTTPHTLGVTPHTLGVTPSTLGQGWVARFVSERSHAHGDWLVAFLDWPSWTLFCIFCCVLYVRPQSLVSRTLGANPLHWEVAVEPVGRPVCRPSKMLVQNKTKQNP